MESLIVFILNTPNVKFLPSISLKMFIYSQLSAFWVWTEHIIAHNYNESWYIRLCQLKNSVTEFYIFCLTEWNPSTKAFKHQVWMLEFFKSLKGAICGYFSQYDSRLSFCLWLELSGWESRTGNTSLDRAAFYETFFICWLSWDKWTK